jgi:hypothetical protein
MTTGLPCTAVRASAAPTENEEGSRHRIVVEMIPAPSCQGVDPATEVDGLASQRNMELRDQLYHRFSVAKKWLQGEVIVEESSSGKNNVRREPSGRSS